MAIIHIETRTLPAAWEEALMACWHQGDSMPTDYDKPGDPPSRDCTLMVNVTHPHAEPRLHKGFIGSYGKIYEYAAEIVSGIHDGWIDPEHGKWSYTYHQRFTDPVNQIAAAIWELKRFSSTRRALISTWRPDEDCGAADPPCVQYCWFRILNGKLIINTHIRSNDGLRAAFMNWFGFSCLQEVISSKLDVGIGEFRWIADSFHIYGSCHQDMANFIEMRRNRPWEDRTIRTDDPQVAEAFASARDLIAKNILVD